MGTVNLKELVLEFDVLEGVGNLYYVLLSFRLTIFQSNPYFGMFFLLLLLFLAYGHNIINTEIHCVFSETSHNSVNCNEMKYNVSLLLLYFYVPILYGNARCM